MAFWRFLALLFNVTLSVLFLRVGGFYLKHILD